MKKANRIIFNIICIIAIITFPYFMLEFVGIVDYVKKNFSEVKTNDNSVFNRWVRVADTCRNDCSS